MPYAVVRESLKVGLPATIPAGQRDVWFFDEGWSRHVLTGNVVSRFATQPVSTTRLLLPEVRPYSLTLRLQPLDAPAAPQQHVEVTLNDISIGSLDLTWDADRIGEYRLEVPVHAVHAGMNRLAFKSQHMLIVRQGAEPFPELRPDQPVAFRLWYVSIVPR